MTRDELLGLLAALRQATVAGRRVPHKPLLLLWLFGRFAAAGSSAGEPADQRVRASGRQPLGRTAAGRHAVRSPGARTLGSAGQSGA
jgi:hypothetical protein